MTRTRPKGRQEVAPLNFGIGVVVAILFGDVSFLVLTLSEMCRKGERVFLYDIV